MTIPKPILFKSLIPIATFKGKILKREAFIKIRGNYKYLSDDKVHKICDAEYEGLNKSKYSYCYFDENGGYVIEMNLDEPIRNIPNELI